MFNRLKRRFEENKNPQRGEKMAAYMRNRFVFYGIDATKRKSLYKEIIQQAKQSKKISWELLNRCWEQEEREFQYFVCDYLLAMSQWISYDQLSCIETYIRSKQWWDTIDGLDGVIGNMGLADPRLGEKMIEWSKDSDYWVRRIAIDHQLGRKDKTDAQLLETIIVNCLGSDEFFINKAIGWSLRDYSKTNPDWVRDFILKYGDRLSKLSIREGSKYIMQRL